VLDRPTQVLAEDVAMLVAQDAHSLPDSLLVESTEALLTLRRRLDGVLARRLQVMDTRDATTAECGRSTRAWLVEDQQLSQTEAAGRMHVARSYPTRPAIVEAMLAGEATQDQAKLIVGFLPKLRTAEARDTAEKELLDLARYADPTYMARALRELTDRLCLNETAEERAVRRHEGRFLRLTDTFDHMVRVDGMLDQVGATLLITDSVTRTTGPRWKNRPRKRHESLRHPLAHPLPAMDRLRPGARCMISAIHTVGGWNGHQLRHEGFVQRAGLHSGRCAGALAGSASGGR
jgi:hypothetical protein